MLHSHRKLASLSHLHFKIPPQYPLPHLPTADISTEPDNDNSGSFPDDLPSPWLVPLVGCGAVSMKETDSRVTEDVQYSTLLQSGASHTPSSHLVGNRRGGGVEPMGRPSGL
jgi:hypothetical protein